MQTQHRSETELYGSYLPRTLQEVSQGFVMGRRCGNKTSLAYLYKHRDYFCSHNSYQRKSLSININIL